MSQSDKNQPLDFEKALAELEEIVRRMEQGEQSLEQALRDYERGMGLSKQCLASLDAAQQRVEVLSGKLGREELVALDDEAAGDRVADDGADDGVDGGRDGGR